MMELSPSDFCDVRKAIHDLCGLAIGDNKEYLIKSRLQPVLERHGLRSYSGLIQRLQQPDSLQLKDQIVAAITTNETSFNRDGHPFESLRQFILPELARKIAKRRAEGLFSGQQARIWCAAVSTGQEAYSVAMAVYDFLRTQKSDLTAAHFPIMGSDISAQVLAAAQLGRYTIAELDRGVTPEQRNRYFRQEQGVWLVDESLRQNIEFRRLNLVQIRPEKEIYDLILCRNVLIYFDQPTRVRLVNTFYEALRPQGILMLGAAESLFGTSDDFETESIGRTTVYRKKTKAQSVSISL